MSVPNMLRVRPHDSVGDLPVPMPGGKHKWLTRAACPPEGYLVADDMHVRQLILHNDLVLLAEGTAALPAAHEGAAP
jgi:hypothetical protein